MKQTFVILMMAATVAALSAQTPAPAAMTAKPAAPNAMMAMTAKPPATAGKTAAKAPAVASPFLAPAIKAPATLPVVKGLQKTIFTIALRYQEIKVGTGTVALPGKFYKILYTGYRASDGVSFDSTDKHRMPLRDKDGKPVVGDDGKPKLGDPQPYSFAQGVGGTVLGFDQGLVGMKVGGKRRLFIPWQVAYGTRNIPDHGPDHPGIPAKSDLIFDVELLDVTDAPPPQPISMGGRPNPMGHPPALGAKPGIPAVPPQPGTPTAPGAAPKPPMTMAPATAPAAPSPAAAPAAAPVAAPVTPAAPAAPQPK